MDFKDFYNKSGRYLSRLIYQTAFNPQEGFGIIDESVKLNNIIYQPYFLKILTGYRPNKNCPTPILYTFFLLTPPKEMKDNFLREVEKKKKGEEIDKEIIADYYLPISPGSLDLNELTKDLKNLLELQLCKNKDYEFEFLLACPTANYDFALVFLEINSVVKLEEAYYPDQIPFDN